nr:retrovirus-related Pol polyprotein from transposon TNT 1-94 [Tanacetum cinerariifolium]
MVEKSKLDEDKEGKAVDPSHYRGMIVTLLYLTASRHDLQFAICMCAWYQARPIEKHVHIVKRIFRYLHGTVHRGLWYPKDSFVTLTTFGDADHAGCQDTLRSTSGSVQFLGERLISWSSKRQKSAVISSTEAEYIALSGCYAQILSMRSQLSDYGLRFNKILMYCDNKSAIALCCNNVQHSGFKHIDIGYHFIKEQVENEVIELYFVNTEYQLADLFTKALGRDKIEFLINKIGMRSFTPETLKQLMDEVDESYFRLLSDIKSKESTLQLVYDVLRICPFFKAFLVTTDVPEIYIQEFWVTATVHHHDIQFKMDNKKHIVNLESFRDMLHICPRVHGQSFADPPFEEEILAFIRFLGHSATIRTLTDVNINKLYQPWRSFAAIINKHETHISQQGSSSTDEGTDDDDEEGSDDDDDQEVEQDDDKDDDEEGGDDDQEYDDEYAKETRDEESFDPIPQTPENSDDEGNGDEDLGLNIGREEGHIEEEEEEEDELYRDVNINHGRGLQMTQEVEDSHVALTPVNLDPQRDNDEFLKSVDENMQKIIKEQVKEQVKVQVSKILPRIEQAINEQLEAEVLTRSSHSSKTSYAVAADLSEMELKKILIEKMEEPFTGPDRGSKRRREGKEHESASALTETATRSAGSIQPWIRELAKQADTRSSFNELMDTLLDFSNFLINRLKVDTLTLELLAGPTYELMKGSCKSLVELEYHLEEVFKATTNQLDCVNPKGQQYPYNLLKPLPLIPNNRGRRVIPFEHFINNDLEYLRGGASSRKYTTSITKTNAADYGHIKWIEDLVPRTMRIKEPIGYDKKIIAVTELKIVEWHSYKHLDWIMVRRDDDKLYKFKEGNFKRLRIQDIEDMFLLLVQGKLTNLRVEERFAFNVSLRMFTRSIVIQRRVEDLQLGVESYQKELNLTKPDSYRSDLKRKEAYTAYSCNTPKNTCRSGILYGGVTS